MLRPYSRAEVSFELRTEIGHAGTNSKVHVAHDEQLDAEIVIKKIAKSALDSVGEFFEESRILYLTSHPNVVPVHYACQDADHIYIAMPYYRRGSLNALLNSRHLTVREIVVLGCQIASGLHNIHSKGLVHFDIKPDNVLLSDRGEAHISDFGLAKRVSRAGTAGQDRFYFKMRAPEAYDTSQYTPAFDVYQFGLTLYRMCNGNGVFERQFVTYGATPGAFDRDRFKFDVRNGRFPDRSKFEEHIPERLRRVIRKCLEPNPSERYQAAIEAANELALVEDRLDWQFSLQGSNRVWVRKDDEEREFKLVVDGHGNATAEKVTSNGRRTRISAFCKNDITSQEIRRFLGDT